MKVTVMLRNGKGRINPKATRVIGEMLRTLNSSHPINNTINMIIKTIVEVDTKEEEEAIIKVKEVIIKGNAVDITKVVEEAIIIINKRDRLERCNRTPMNP